PNRTGQQPAVAGQTRAPKVTSNTAYRVETVAKGLVNPWSLAFLPDGRMLVTERPGRLRIVGKGRVSPPVTGVPPVAHGGQLGLYGLALDPAFARTRLVYLAYSAPQRGGSALTVARARLTETGSAAQLADLKVIFQAQP